MTTSPELGRGFTVVGVAPRGFVGAALSDHPPQIFLPLSMYRAAAPQASHDLLTDRGPWGRFDVIARLAPGATLERASAQAAEVAARLRAADPTISLRYD